MSPNESPYRDLPEEAVDNTLNGGTPSPTLHQTHVQTRQTVVELNKPRGQFSIIALEVLLILAQVAIGLVILQKHAGGDGSRIARRVSIVFWGYLLILGSWRLLSSHTKRSRFPNLWYHTALLYGFQWIQTTLRFRSSLIHPYSAQARSFTIAEFCICTVLALIAIISRKGNKAVPLEYEGDLEPSHEPLANVLSLSTFSWVDSIVWQGYRKTLELPDVWNLEMRDKAEAVMADFRQLKKTSKLAWHLMRYFRKELIIQATWAAASGLSTFAPTLLLKAFLEWVESPTKIPANAAWFYIGLLAITSCIKSITDGQALWIGRKTCIRLRAIVIGEIYAKSLRRKAAAGNDSILGKGEPKKQASNPDSGGKLKAATEARKAVGKTPAQKARKPRKSSFVAHTGISERIGDNETEPKQKEAKGKSNLEADPNTQANVGTIINLMAVDSFKISEIGAYLHFLWGSTPVQLIMCVILLYRILGWSALASILMMILLMPLNLFIAKQFSKKQKRVMAATDIRINTTNEVLQNIRIVKYFAWERHFGHKIDEKREAEVRALRDKYTLWACAATVWFSVPILITFLSFFLYTVIEKRPLVPSVAFSALSLFGILRYPLDQLADMIAHVQEAKVSVDRVEEFLNEEETEKYDQLHRGRQGVATDSVIGLDKATLSWGGRNAQSEQGKTAFRLINMNVRFQTGRLNIIAGPTGSGKTSLLMALLGEMTLLDGVVHLPGGVSRENLRVDPDTGLTESVAYCAQQAWLVNDTIKQNILFASPIDETRYRAVIAACALERDLDILADGDDTLVGEKGIALSGGQKQRISLARALYSNSRHVLLDDCLSAVDSHTAKHIFEYCIMGPLMFSRTCILVTHNVTLCVPRSHYVVVLLKGKIAAQGPPDEVIMSGGLGDEFAKSRPGSRFPSQAQSRAPSAMTITNAKQATSNKQNGHANGEGKDLLAKASKVGAADLRVERKATGSVNIRVIATYLQAMGPWYYWVLAVVIFVVQQIGSVAANVWIRIWSNSYLTEIEVAGASSATSHPPYVQGLGLSSTSFSATGSFWSLPVSSKSSSLVPKMSVLSRADGVNDLHYLLIYALLGLGYILISFSREGYIFWGSLSASRKLHTRLLTATTRAKLQFFDTTPLGQLMNRFSKDVEAIDQDVSPIAMGSIGCLASLISIVVLISVITPGFLIAGFFITLIYYMIGTLYVRSSRDLKRLESIQRSPIYQHFGETLSGIVTIRAYGDEKRFRGHNLSLVDTHNRPFIYLWATNRWLSLRVDFAGALVAFFAGVFIIVSIKTIDAGSAGLSLTYAVMFTENMLWLVRLYALNEQNMNSVERIKEYIELEQEAKAIIEDNRPPSNWPDKGAIDFVDYSTRYRSDLEPVLRNLTFSVKAGERMGIVGRTGAGKSSLTLAVFRGLEAQTGKIILDGIDVSQIGLQDLRESITIVPQDPTLFTGTIRSNLDPFTLFTDEEIFACLRRVQLIESPLDSIPPIILETPADTDNSTVIKQNGHGERASVTAVDEMPSLAPVISDANLHSNENPFLNLSTPVAESGSNLSQGQRQLLCLARALLKKPRVLIMDEATASIDYGTDAKIQDTLRQSAGVGGDGTTVLTIAHRLQTIVDYDKVLVLDKGRLVEYGPPWELLQQEEGWFRGMCETSGDGEALMEIAMEAGRTKGLIDA